MNILYSWIKDYVELDENLTIEEFVDKMTMSGSKVEAYERLDDGLENIVVGKIVDIKPHENANSLIVCKVDVGEEIQICTGANNVKVGDFVPVVLHGGRVATDHDGNKIKGGVKIKKGKLRGVESNGMLCSIVELGLDKNLYNDDGEGIYILNNEYKDLKPGQDIVKLMELDDFNIEFEITSNRIDCFGIYGIAREVAATFNKPFKKISFDFEFDSNFDFDIEIKTNNCKRYSALKVENAKIEESPLYIKNRLRKLGIRPINNYVDITNYCLLEFGQPMHAFDFSKIEGGIIVENAIKGEKFETLDEIERELDDDIMMIRDHKKSLAIAGIMGGENSKILDTTKEILFESASFDCTNIRLSSKKIGLRTDSSSKFEKDLDEETTILALKRAVSLVREFKAGEVILSVKDICNFEKKSYEVEFDKDYINNVLGTNLSKEEMIDILGRLELNVLDDKVVPPTFRKDIRIKADLVEEVARLYGYDNIESKLPTGDFVVGGYEKKLAFANKIRETLEVFGYSETLSYSFESEKVFDKLLVSDDDSSRNVIKIANPLGEDYSILRTLACNGLLNSLSNNFKNKNEEIKLYEISKVYLPKALPLVELPEERQKLVFGMYSKNLDFYYMKAVLNGTLYVLGYKDEKVYVKADDVNYLHPGRSAHVYYGDIKIATIGQVHPLVSKNYGITDDVYIAELDLTTLMEIPTDIEIYKSINRFPTSARDISLIVDKKVQSGDIVNIIKRAGGSNLRKVSIFDIYEGNQIEEGKRSISYSLVFQANDRTLKEDEVSESMEKILNKLQENDIVIR